MFVGFVGFIEFVGFVGFVGFIEFVGFVGFVVFLELCDEQPMLTSHIHYQTSPLGLIFRSTITS